MPLPSFFVLPHRNPFGVGAKLTGKVWMPPVVSLYVFHTVDSRTWVVVSLIDRLKQIVVCSLLDSKKCHYIDAE